MAMNVAHPATTAMTIAAVSMGPGGITTAVPAAPASTPPPATSAGSGDRFRATYGRRTGSVVAAPQRKQIRALSAISVPHDRQVITRRIQNTEYRIQKKEERRPKGSGARADVP
jgi:hypothetical protein